MLDNRHPLLTVPGYLQLRYPGILGKRKYVETQGGNGRARGGERECVEKCCFCLQNEVYMSQLLLLGKVEYGGGPIFKVVLEC